MPLAVVFKSRAWNFILCFALVLFVSQKVFSTSYAGLIIEKSAPIEPINSLTILLTSSQQNILLVAASIEDRNLFERLQIGDYLAFDGEKVIKKNNYRLVSIDYIGLKSVLGFWNADDGRCYEFQSFTHLAVYEPVMGESCQDLKFSRFLTLPIMYKYYITPNELGWDIFVSDRASYFSAEFDFISSDEINAKIFDTETGKVNTELYLWR